MRKYLFAFTTGNWTYCSGVTLIIAESTEQALQLGNEALDRDEIAEGSCSRGFFARLPEDIECVWVLHSVYPLSTTAHFESGVELSEANYA